MFIAGDLIPLRTVESEHFKNLMSKLDPKYQLPSRKHMSSKLLHEKAAKIRNNVKLQLKNAESVCLTIDLWSNRDMRGYMGITGHFILDWALKSVMICCKRVKGRHTADNIRMEYEEVISCFDVGHKIISVVSDNASNMVKAFSLPGCESEDDPTFSDSSDEEDCDQTDSKSNLLPESLDADCLPDHLRCFAHTLQLVVKDGLAEVSGHLKSVLTKAAKIVTYVRKSVHATEVLQDFNRLQAANATRWNSQLTMINSVLNIPEDKLNMIDCDYC